MSNSIDIMQEFMDLFEKEDVVATFDFLCPFETGKPVSGLCKISKSKDDASSMHYISLVFIVDLPAANIYGTAKEIVEKLDESNLKKVLPRLQTVAPAPALNTGPEIFLKQIDLIMDDGFIPNNTFISEKLIPAVCRITHFNLGELVWWDSAHQETPSNDSIRSRMTSERQESVDSFLDRLKKFFRTNSEHI